MGSPQTSVLKRSTPAESTHLTIMGLICNTWKPCVIGCKLVLITNRRSHMGFWLVPKLVTLTYEMALILCYFTKFGSFMGQLRESGWRQTYTFYANFSYNRMTEEQKLSWNLCLFDECRIASCLHWTVCVCVCVRGACVWQLVVRWLRSLINAFTNTRGIH